MGVDPLDVLDLYGVFLDDGIVGLGVVGCIERVVGVLYLENLDVILKGFVVVVEGSDGALV